MKVEKFGAPLHCEECNLLKNNINIIIPENTIINSKIYLCDECLQELNRYLNFNYNENYSNIKKEELLSINLEKNNKNEIEIVFKINENLKELCKNKEKEITEKCKELSQLILKNDQ